MPDTHHHTDPAKGLSALAEKVRDARLAAGLSKEAVARKAEVSSITYKRVEDGDPVRDVSLARILGALDLTAEETVTTDSNDEPEFEFLTRVREDLTPAEMDQLMTEATPYLEMLVRDIKNRHRGNP